MDENGSPSPRFSVCIPAYNRPADLKLALESVARQCGDDTEIVISEDCSPLGSEIAGVAGDFAAREPRIAVRYFSNETNLGYDANLRSLLDKARGDYCVFMGDDDVFEPGMLAGLRRAVAHANVGVVLRSWRSIDRQTRRELDRHVYFPEDRLFGPGPGTIAAFFRRSVFISGLTVRRREAAALRTTRFDGTLLYQLHLVGNLLAEMHGYYISEVVVSRRTGNEHYFGSSDAEKASFRPRELSWVQSVTFIRGLLEIAAAVESRSHGVAKRVLQDLGYHSYPLLSLHSENRSELRRYACALRRLGVGDGWAFRAYYVALYLFGRRPCDRALNALVHILGHTPVLGAVEGAAAR